MKKNLFCRFALFFFLLCPMNVSAQQTIEDINAIKERLQIDLKSMQAEYQIKKESLEKEKDNLPESILERRNKELNELEQSIKAYEAEINKMNFDYLDCNGYKYKIPDNKEWEWLQNMRGYEYDDGLEHVQTTFPVETNYYKSEKYPEYQFYPLEFPIPGKGWYVTDNKKNLLGVQYKGFEADSLEKALMLYDFEHNAYNIKSESRGTQEWVLYNLKKRGNHNADALDWAQLGIIVGAGTVLDESQRLRYLFASGRISKTEYDRQIAELKKTAKAVNRAANRLANSMPSAEEQERAEKYIKQLESDYYHKYNRETVNAERLNGTQMMLYTTDTKVKALLTYYLNDNGKLTIAIDIIEKK